MFLEDKSKFAGGEVKAGPFSLVALVAWLRTKDASEAYDYWDHGNCAMCQFAKSLGYTFDGTVQGYALTAFRAPCLTRLAHSSSARRPCYDTR